MNEADHRLVKLLVRVYDQRTVDLSAQSDVVAMLQAVGRKDIAQAVEAVEALPYQQAVARAHEVIEAAREKAEAL